MSGRCLIHKKPCWMSVCRIISCKFGIFMQQVIDFFGHRNAISPQTGFHETTGLICCRSSITERAITKRAIRRKNFRVLLLSVSKVRFNYNERSRNSARFVWSLARHGLEGKRVKSASMSMKVNGVKYDKSTERKRRKSLARNYLWQGLSKQIQARIHLVQH